MSDIVISYARETEAQAQRVEQALRALGYDVWRDDQIAAHREFGAEIEERLTGAKVVLVLWSADAAKSTWVRSEASRARAMGKLAQLTLDKAPLPIPFDQIQCANLVGWAGEAEHAGWRKVMSSISELTSGSPPAPAPPIVRKAAALALPDKPSIAVLRFTDTARTTGEDYFTDGMVEEIVTALSRFPALFVIGAASGLSYREGARNLRAIAEELGVRYLLEGSVRRSGERVRISVNLTDAVEGQPIWSERFEGTLEDVFALQDTVANAVAGQIEPNIEKAEIRRANARPTQELGAYDLYLRAIHRIRVFEGSALADALALMDQAIARDPDFARAWALTALIRGSQLMYGWSLDRPATRDAAREEIRRALRTGGDDADVLRLAAAATNYTAESESDRAPAEAMIDRALVLNPGSSSSWNQSGFIKLGLGRFEEAVEHFRNGLRLDPRSPERPFVLAGIGSCLVFLGRIEEAIPLLREAIHLKAGNTIPQAFLTVAYARSGRMEEARASLAALQAVSPVSTFVSDVYGGARGREIMRAGLALAGADV